MQPLWDFLADNKDALTIALAIVTSLFAVLWGAWKLFLERWWKNRLRVDVKVFEVITDPAILLPKLYATENDDSPLADHRITYQSRDPNRDIQTELKAALSRSRYLLITAPTGYGKTREGGVLAQGMMLEGWRVLRIKTGWLDLPKTLPEELGGNRSRILIFLDDLNGLFSTGELTQSPRAEQMPLLSQLSYYDRLLQVLDMLEGMCTENEVRVIATARSEADQWKLLDFDEKDRLWKRFERIEISEPADTAIVNLLEDATKQADLKADENDFEAIAHKSDGTYRNILLNLRRFRSQNKPVSKDDFTDTLDGSWKDIYERAVRKYPAVEYIYDAIDILRQAGIEIFPFLVEPTALMIWGGNRFQKIFRSLEIRRALHYLTQDTKIIRKANDILKPSDGQIEAKHSRTASIKYLTKLQPLLNKSIRKNKKIISSLNSYGYNLYKIGLYDEAEATFRIVIKLNPSHVLAYSNLGYLLNTLKRYEEAEDAYRKAVAANPNSAVVYPFLGNLLSELERFSEAEDAYRKAVAADPNDAYGYEMLGILLSELERFSEAEDAYRKAVAADPNDAYGYEMLGILLKKLGRFGEAEDEYRKAVAADPNDAHGYILLGDLLKELRRFAEAEDEYRKAVVADPNNANGYTVLGDLLKELERGSEAEDVYRQAVEIDPSYVTPYKNLGVLLKDLKRYDEAEAAFRKAIELNPSQAIGYIILGNLLSNENLKRYDEAEAAFRKAIELNPSEADGYIILGNMMNDLNRYNEAEAAFRKAVELNPINADNYFLLGVLLHSSLKHYEEAETAYRKAIELDSTNFDCYRSLANMLRFNMNNREEEVLSLREKMIEMNPEDFNSYLAIASISKQLRKDISNMYTNKVRQYVPEDDWYNRSCLESVCDNVDLAFEHLQNAARADKFDASWAWEDPDLQWIRDDARFIEIVGLKPEK